MPLGSFRLNSLSKNMVKLPIRTAATITRGGDTVISTSQSKFGSSSAYFDGTGDTLLPNVKLPTDTWTAEMWFRVSTIDRSTALWKQGTTINTAGYVRLGIQSDNTVVLRTTNGAGGSVVNIVGSTVSADTWYHVAVTKNESSFNFFINGVSQGTGTDGNSTTQTTDFIIGEVNFFSEFIGYIDEIRVSNVARYSSNFTPSTTALVNDTNTLLLLHLEGSNNSTTFTDDNA